MKISTKDILKLIISLGLTALVIFAIKDSVDWNQLGSSLLEIKYGWVVLSIGLSIVSHYLRAYRWRMLLEVGGHATKSLTLYLALMTGYLANMAFPRLGEVVRCTLLKEEYDIPVSYSLGTVVTDRLLDLVMLGVATVILLILDFKLLSSYFIKFVDDKVPFLAQYWLLLLLLGIAGLFLLIWLIKKAKEDDKQGSFFYKVGSFVTSVLSGMKSVTKVKNPLAFWLSTTGIWLMYFLMLYVISFGFEATDEMSPTAGLAVLVMGSLGMVAPVNNGIGAYQVFVAEILLLYGITYNDGFIFAVVSHGSQVAAVLVIGFVSLMILNLRKRKKRLATEQ